MCQPKLSKVEQLAQHWLAAVENGDGKLEHELFTRIEDIDNQPPKLLDAALLYASWGWPVFPLRPKDKRPATRNGFKDATTDTDRIRAWWAKNPESNIGLPTGIKFDVIDIDTPHGVTSYQKMLDADILPDSHGMVATSSSGIHHYITPLGGGNLAGTLPGIDYRGAGGYVVAPPSTRGPRTQAWTWTHHPSPVITGAVR